MFRNEMSSQARPSLDGMPEEVLAKGRRARRARTAKIASTAFAAVAVGIVAVAVVVPAIGPVMPPRRIWGRWLSPPIRATRSQSLTRRPRPPAAEPPRLRR
jgi:hypothetical protein